ncbi:hypothetical protein OSTOST_10900 [Ostertagia ostertagi]
MIVGRICVPVISRSVTLSPISDLIQGSPPPELPPITASSLLTVLLVVVPLTVGAATVMVRNSLWSPSTTIVIYASSSIHGCTSVQAAAKCRNATTRPPTRCLARTQVAPIRCNVARRDRRHASELVDRVSRRDCRTTSAPMERESVTATLAEIHPMRQRSAQLGSPVHTRQTTCTRGIESECSQ